MEQLRRPGCLIDGACVRSVALTGSVFTNTLGRFGAIAVSAVPAQFE